MIGTVMQSPDWGGEDGGETYIAFRMICPIDDLRRGSWGRRRLRQVGRDVGRRSFCHRGELLRATRYRILDLESRGQRSYSTPGLSRTDVPRGQFRINSIPLSLPKPTEKKAQVSVARSTPTNQTSSLFHVCLSPALPLVPVSPPILPPHLNPELRFHQPLPRKTHRFVSPLPPSFRSHAARLSDPHH